MTKPKPKSFLSTDKNLGKNDKFPLCSKYGLHEQVGAFGLTHICIPAYEVELALAKAEAKDRVYISHTADEMREIIRTAPKGATIELHEGYKKGCWECYLRERIAQLEKKLTLHDAEIDRTGREQGKLAERERIFKTLAEFMSFGRCFKDDKRFWRYNEETIKWIAVMRGIADKKTRGD